MPSSQSSSSPNQVKNAAEKSLLYHPAIVWLLRIIVGATFVVSGFVKSIDPWGSVIKIGEYLSVWGWSIPDSLVTIAAFLLGGVEFVLGSLLLLGCYRRVAPWLLTLMMAVMLPLTLYIAIANPVADCGCFGDFFVLSNTATFVKNIFLTAFLVYLLFYNSKVGGLFIPYVQWIVGGLLSLYIFIVSFIGYNVQPMLDFRRFAPDTLLVPHEDEESEEDADEDVTFEYIYSKDGRTESFSIDALPDSTWTFVERKLISGTTEVSDGFTVIEDGEDIAPDIIDNDGEQFIVTIPDISKVDLSYTYLINDLDDFITERGGSLVALVNSDERGIDWWKDVSMASYPIYNAEPTLLKELARGRAALVYLDHGVVKWKRMLSSISYTYVTETPAAQLLDELDPDPSFYLRGLTAFFGMILLVILFLDRSGRLVAWLIKHRKRKAGLQAATDGHSADIQPE